MKKNQNMYDALPKIYLSDKQVLANILKEVVTEYKGLSLDEVRNLIEDGSDSRYINGTNTEDNSLNEGQIRYDVLFTAKLPNSNKNIGLYINLEAQSYSTKYPIIERAVYYAARLISRQKGIEFVGQNYQDLKKVYSIWICIPEKKEDRNSISKYTINEDCIHGNHSHNKADYDLMDITIFSLDDSKELNVHILSLLKMLFIDLGMPSKEISYKLEKDYNIKYSEQEVSSMSTLSSSIERLGYNKGIEQGIKQGIELGAESQKVSIIKSMLANGLNIDEALKLAGIDIKEKENILKKLNA